MIRAMFGEADLTEALEKAGSAMKRKTSAYLIGGCAMTFMGRKVATKDIDIVFRSTADTKDFQSAMEKAGFAPIGNLTGEYNNLGTFAILEDKKKMRFDIFDKQVCRALKISDGMVSRARHYKDFGNLSVNLMSPEDIFLFKGITEREGDLDDMRILAEMRLEWKAIEKECLSQEKSGHWAYMLGTKLMELKAKFGIDSPIIKILMDHADLDLLRHVFVGIIGPNKISFKGVGNAIKEKYGYSYSWTRKQLAILMKNKIIGVTKKDGMRVFYVL
jgi:hypothetical protein